MHLLSPFSLNLPLYEHKKRPSYVQAYQRHCCSHMPHCWKSHFTAHMVSLFHLRLTYLELCLVGYSILHSFPFWGTGLAVALVYCSGLRAWWSAGSRLCFPLWLPVGGSGLTLCGGSGLGGLSVGRMVGAWCFGCLSGPPGFACWISFALVFGSVCCWVLVLALSPFCVLVCVFWGMVRWVWGLLCGQDICVS